LAVGLAGGGLARQAQPTAMEPDVRDGVWSADGRLLAFTSRRTGTYQIHVSRADGTGARQVTTGEGPFYYPSFNPDSTTLVAMEYRSADVRVWTIEVDGSEARMLTAEGEFNADPYWSPDGRDILVHGRRGTQNDIYRMGSDGSNLRPIVLTPAAESNPVVSPDGTRLLCVTNQAGRLDLQVMDVDGSHPVLLTTDPSRDHLVPKWSLDGTRITYYSVDRQAGPASAEVFVLDLASGHHRQITTNAHRDMAPSWSPDATRLLITTVRNGRSSLVTVELATLKETPLPISYAGVGDSSVNR
jgi:TolB protein